MNVSSSLGGELIRYYVQSLVLLLLFKSHLYWCGSSVHLIFCSAKKLGVTEVPLEVVNFISHATQSRLRSLLEKVSAVAQHRTDGGKVKMAHLHSMWNTQLGRIVLHQLNIFLPPSPRMKNFANKHQTFALSCGFLSSLSELRNREKTNKKERSCWRLQRYKNRVFFSDSSRWGWGQKEKTLQAALFGDVWKFSDKISLICICWISRAVPDRKTLNRLAWSRKLKRYIFLPLIHNWDKIKPNLGTRTVVDDTH